MLCAVKCDFRNAVMSKRYKMQISECQVLWHLDWAVLHIC